MAITTTTRTTPLFLKPKKGTTKVHVQPRRSHRLLHYFVPPICRCSPARAVRLLSALLATILVLTIFGSLHLNSLLDRSGFWGQQGLAVEYRDLFDHLNEGEIFLLEPSLLAKAYAKNGSVNGESDASNCLRQLRWKYRLEREWNRNWLTVGVFEKNINKVFNKLFNDPELNLEAFTVTRNIFRSDYHQAPAHVFLQSSRNTSHALYLHLIVLQKDSKKESFTIFPVPEDDLSSLNLTINPEYHHYLTLDRSIVLEPFHLTSFHGITVPTDINQFFSQLPSLHYPPTVDRVLAVDSQIRQIASLKTTSNLSPFDYIHPKATLSDIMRPRLPTETTMKSALELSHALDLSLDITRPCGGNLGRHHLLVVFSFTRADAFERRRTIRRTFGSSLRRHSASDLYFLIGKPSNPTTQSRIMAESRQYNDLIQGDYLDTYFNCTLKSVSMIRWTSLNCPLTRWFLKLDDDSFIRVNPLLGLLWRLPPTHIIGAKANFKEAIPRRLTSRWRLHPRFYPYPTYPTYINGIYLIPGQLAIILYESIVTAPLYQTIPAVPFEDAFITGILATKADIPLIGNKHLSSDSAKRETANLDGVYILFEKISSQGIRRFWKIYADN